MSGDVFGNGMLLSKAIRLVAAFDHRHIFLDPEPDPAKSWAERQRMFDLPSSSWDDYDKALISKGGGVFARSMKRIPLSAQVRALLGTDEAEMEPEALIAAILQAPVDLLWFGGIGTYVKASSENNATVGDPTNDPMRVDAATVRARVIGEGGNLGVTQAGRIEFALRGAGGVGGRINTDFIDNSAGVDCSDNEVNIKIPLNREMMEGRLGFEDRNAFLKEMTDEVAEIVLEDNRLQTLALSLAEKSGADALPSQVRVLEMLEASGRINRTVDNFESNQDLLRRAQEHRGLTRPELAVLMSHSKLALQAAIERSDLAADPLLVSTLHGSFPATMQKRFARAIDQHRLRGEIIATELANRIVNRLGFVIPFELAEEEGVSLAQIGTAYVAADALLGLADLWTGIENAALPEQARLALFDAAAGSVRFHVADILRAMPAGAQPHEITGRLAKPIERLNRSLPDLLREVAVRQADAMRDRLAIAQDDPALVERIVRLYELDGVFGIAALSEGHGLDAIQATKAYALLGERLGLDWAKATASRYVPLDPWERLLAAGLARDFESLRLDFLGRADGKDPVASVETWLRDHDARIAQFRTLVDRARAAAIVTVSMLAQIASQARLLLAR
jgi:glutamate dehydrogenase